MGFTWIYFQLFMMTEPRGRALLISNKFTEKAEWRRGADIDHRNMKRVLTKFGFIISGDFRDYTAKVTHMLSVYFCSTTIYYTIKMF